MDFLVPHPHQSKKGDGAAEGELKKFDGAGQDSDLVEALERDIVSRNPNVHWYGDRMRTLKHTHICVGNAIKNAGRPLLCLCVCVCVCDFQGRHR